MKRIQHEQGQALVEFGLIASTLFILTLGLLDVGRAFYQYNALSAAARYGARWGAVEGGAAACANSAENGTHSADWCNQEDGTSSTAFWSQAGNAPLQATGVSCPTSFDQTFTGYYNVSDYIPPAKTNSTTIVGAIAQRFDTNSSSNNFIQGGLAPGFNLSQLKVCIQLTPSPTTAAPVGAGFRVAVFMYYPFQPVSGLLTRSQFNLKASSAYVVE